MAKPLPLSGELSRRRLGTQSGDMMRQARSLQRQGFGRAAEAVALGSAKAKTGEGGIQSAESNVAKQGYAMRMQGGLLESQRRATLGGGVQNGASGVQGAAPANNLQPNPAPALPSPTPSSMGTTPAKPVGVPPTAPAVGAPAANEVTTAARTRPSDPPINGKAAELSGGAPAAGVPSAPPPLIARPAAPRGMIGVGTNKDGTPIMKPAAGVLAQGRTNARSNAPTNLSGDALGVGSLPTESAPTREDDRAGILSRMRAESGGGTSRTRLDVLDSINQERKRAGQPDVKFTNQEIADADVAAKGGKVPYDLQRPTGPVTGTPYSIASPNAPTLADTKIATLPGKTSNDMRADAVNARLAARDAKTDTLLSSSLFNRGAAPARATVPPAAAPSATTPAAAATPPKVARPVSTPVMTTPEDAAAGQTAKGLARQKQVIEETKAGNARGAEVVRKEEANRKAKWDTAWNAADKSTPDWLRGTYAGRVRRQLVARTTR